MKQVLITMSLAMLLWTGCKDDSSSDNEEVIAGVEITASMQLSEDYITVPKAGATKTITATTNAGAVTATCSESWLTAQVTTGDPSTITITIAEYTVTNTDTDYEPRTATVTIEANASSGTISKTVTIYQEPENYLEPTENTRLNGVAQNATSDYSGKDWKIGYYTNGDVEIETPWWIVYSSTEDGTDNKYHKISSFTVLMNYDKVRTGSIVFTLGDKTMTCTITEEATEYDFSGVAKTAKEVAQEMTLGWTMVDAYTDDARTQLTNGLMEVVADSGINVVRIPCSFKGTGTEINDYMLSGVKNAVDEIVGKGLFAVVSLADDGWLSGNLNSTDTATIFPIYTSLWTSIANELIDYDYHLVFEGLDKLDETASNFPSTVYERLNALFIQSVRRTGGNNYKRCLITPGYDPTNSFYIVVPTNDPTEDRLMVSFQFFCPEEFANTGATKKLWGDAYASDNTGNYCSSYTASDIAKTFSNLLSKYTTVPVILSSFGSVAHSTVENSSYTTAEALYGNTVAKTAMENGMVPILMDDNTIGEGSFGLLQRNGSSSAITRAVYFNAVRNGALGYQYAIESDTE